jgi:CPA2 family monovalent cation:H+ antiporter-2
MENFLIALGGAFLAAGLLARAGRRIGLPTIPLFMAAGIVFGPNTPGIALVDHPEDLEFLAALGLVLLLFHLGLEFSLDDLSSGGKPLAIAGATYLALNLTGGLLFGFAIGWGTREALVIAGAVGISSSAIVTKLLVELRRLANPETRLILGIVVVEDLFLALYLAVLQPVISGSSGLGAVRDVAIAFLFVLVVVVIARKGSFLVGKLIATPDDELLTVGFLGVALLTAGVAEELGVSDAIGAFLAGTIVAATVVAPRVERLVLPLRDAFAAVFFFAFGLSLDPGDASHVLPVVLAAVALSFVLNTIAGVAAARLIKQGPQAAARIGLTVLARGEFSLILASLAAAAGLDPRITPFVGLYVFILAIASPVLASRPGWLARAISATNLVPAAR